MIIIQNISIIRDRRNKWKIQPKRIQTVHPRILTSMKEICAKWSKFSEQDVAALKSKADLVSQVVTKYGLPQIQAQSDVDALLKGRQVGAGA